MVGGERKAVDASELSEIGRPEVETPAIEDDAFPFVVYLPESAAETCVVVAPQKFAVEVDITENQRPILSYDKLVVHLSTDSNVQRYNFYRLQCLP